MLFRSTPVGSLLIGTLAERWGTPLAMGVSCGFALVLMVCMTLAAKDVRRLH